MANIKKKKTDLHIFLWIITTGADLAIYYKLNFNVTTDDAFLA